MTAALYTLDPRTYVTTARMAADTVGLCAALPPDVSTIVGMARSGLLPAALLACQLHLPLYAASDQQVTPCGNGWRLRNARSDAGPIVLVDDTVCSGRTMTAIEPWVRIAFPGRPIIRAAIYSTPHGLAKLDVAAVELAGPHYLEWNYFNSTLIHRAYTDMDGILCGDIAPADDDDGPRYLRALENARPRHLPRREPIAAIVTARLEKYRDPTTAWLARWGVRCRDLVMGPWKNVREKARPRAISDWKAAIVKRVGVPLFIESDPRQAREIHAASGRPVLCPALESVLVST